MSNPAPTTAQYYVTAIALAGPFAIVTMQCRDRTVVIPVTLETARTLLVGGYVVLAWVPVPAPDTRPEGTKP